MILFPLHHKSQLPDLTSHTNSLQPAFNNHKRTFQSVLNATDFKNQPTSFSLLSHSRFTSPPTLFSLFFTTYSNSPLSEGSQSNWHRSWMLRAAVQGRRLFAQQQEEGRGREEGESTLGVFDLAGLGEALQAEFICWALAVSRHCCCTVGYREVEYCIPS